MATAGTEILLQHIRHIAAPGLSLLSDKELLERFIARRDEAAFAALVQRHAPMVFRLCRGVLEDAHDAEDAFQATFFVLSRKAGTVRRQESVASWLYGVAHRLALKAKVAGARRRARESRAPPKQSADPLAELTLREAQAILDDELARLPDKYRTPLVLCCLEGRARDEAAHLLGWPVGLLKSRLEQGRERLRRRLTRRGLTLTGALATTFVMEGTAPAAVSATLTRLTVEGALAFSTGKAMAGSLSAQAAALAQATLKGMILTKLKVGGALVLALSVLAGGVGVTLHRALADKHQEVKQDAEPKGAVKGADQQQAGKAKPTGTDLYGDPLPAGAIARLGTVRFRHGDKVASVAFSPNGKQLASGGEDNTARLWEPATGKELGCFQAHNGPGSEHAWVESVAFSPDGRYLVAGTGNGPAVVIVWDLLTARELYRSKENLRKVTSVAVSPNGKIVACGAADQRIHVFDLATGKELQPLAGHGEMIEAVAFSADGSLLASASRDRTVRLWDPATAKELRRLDGHHDLVLCVTFSPDAKLLASGSWDKTIRLWDPHTGKETGVLPGHVAPVSALTFLAGGKTLASGSWDHTIRLWDVSSRKEQRQIDGHLGPVTSLALSPDGQTLASGGWDRTVRLWAAIGGKELQTSGGHRQTVTRVAFSPDGKLVASGSEDQTIRLWDASTGSELRQLKGHLGFVDLLTFSQDGKRLTAASWDHTIREWETATGKPLGANASIRGRLASGRSFEIPSGKAGRRNSFGAAIGLLFSPDRKVLAGGDGQGTFSLWEDATGKEIRQFRGQTGWVSLAFSPDSKSLACGSSKNDGTVILWDVATGKEVQQFKAPPHMIYALAFSADGKYLAGASVNNKFFVPEVAIQLWEVASGKTIRELHGHHNAVLSLAFSGDGKTLASASADKTVRLWEVLTGKERRRFQGHQGLVWSVAFSPDGQKLVSGSQDTTAMVWDVTGFRKEVSTRPELTSKALDARWADLAGDDAGKAYRAIWAMTAAPLDSVPFLQKRLQPVSPVSAERISRLISDLDDKRFAVRQKAATELVEMGNLAEAALRKALQGNPSLETRNRLERLLEKLATIPAPPELRALRAIEVLEHIATPEAQQVLSKLANGAPGARMTEEAKRSLVHLARRSQ